MLISDLDNENLETLLGETIGYAVLDSGCTRSVCGKVWLDTYLDSLSASDRNKVSFQKSTREFRFGDGQTYKSEWLVSVPIHLGNQKAILETEVVYTHIPLLLSRISLKRAGATLNFEHDEIVMFGERIPIVISKSGHYCVSLSRKMTWNSDCEKVFFSTPLSPSDDVQDTTKKVQKLHRQFAHPAPERLKKLVRDSGVRDKKIMDMIDEVSTKCDVCRRFRKPPLRPSVAFPTAEAFNDVVAMDLKVMGSVYILHMIDHATRYSSACVISNKRKETIVRGVMEHWIKIFGPPKHFLTDNGGEFVNDHMIEFAEKFNIVLRTTAAESAWSNGLCERHNGVLADLMVKTMDDTKCDMTTAVCWALSAKNSLSNVYGYSPNQLVFGKSVALPSVQTDKPPAQNSTCTSEYLANNLNALHKARQAHIQQESCERLRRALSRKTRSYSDTVFSNGDSVYYWRNNSNEWHGPAKVLGKDGQQCLLKHGGIYVRVHPCRMQLVSPKQDLDSDRAPQQENNVDTPHSGLQDVPHQEDDSSESGPESDDERKEFDLPPSPPTTPAQQAHIPVAAAHDDFVEQPQLENIPEDEVLVPDQEPANESLRDKQPIHKPQSTNEANPLPLAVRRLQHFNKPGSHEDIFYGRDTMSTRFDDAKTQEIQKWKDMGAYEEVADTGQPYITSRWVCTEKKKGDDIVLKARLVARGFEEDTEQMKTDSPTCSKESLRTVLCILASNKWSVHSMDVKSAYLQGNPIERELCLKPPAFANTTKLWKLKKTPYGLSDAGRQWYIRILKELINLGAHQSKYDKAVFVWYDAKGVTSGIMAVHVDDFLYGGSNTFIDTVIPQLRAVFQIGSEESSCFRYIGLSVKETENGIELSSEGYGDSCEEIDTRTLGTDRDRHLSPEETTRLRRVSGQLNWVTTQSRPDMAFENCIIGNSVKEATVRDIHKANRVLKKLQIQPVTLLYPQIDLASCQITAFCDASFANLPGNGSQGGYVIFLTDTHGSYCLLAWQSRRIRRVVNSTIAAECSAAVEAAGSSIYLSTCLEGLLFQADQQKTGDSGRKIPVSIVCDNKSLVDAVHTTTQSENKWLRIDISVLRDMLQHGDVTEFRWISTDLQVANSLTKSGCSSLYLLEILQNKLRFDTPSAAFIEH